MVASNDENMRRCANLSLVMPTHFLAFVLLLAGWSHAFCPSQLGRPLTLRKGGGKNFFPTRMSNREEDENVTEEVRVRILGDRRKQVRSALKAAESLRNFRISKGKKDL